MKNTVSAQLLSERAGDVLMGNKEVLKIILSESKLLTYFFSFLPSNQVLQDSFQYIQFANILGRLTEEDSAGLFNFLINNEPLIDTLIFHIGNENILKKLVYFWNVKQRSIAQAQLLHLLGIKSLMKFLDSEYDSHGELFNHLLVFLHLITRRHSSFQIIGNNFLLELPAINMSLISESFNDHCKNNKFSDDLPASIILKKNSKSSLSDHNELSNFIGSFFLSFLSSFLFPLPFSSLFHLLLLPLPFPPPSSLSFIASFILLNSPFLPLPAPYFISYFLLPPFPSSLLLSPIPFLSSLSPFPSLPSLLLFSFSTPFLSLSSFSLLFYVLCPIPLSWFCSFVLWFGRRSMSLILIPHCWTFNSSFNTST